MGVLVGDGIPEEDGMGVLVEEDRVGILVAEEVRV